MRTVPTILVACLLGLYALSSSAGIEGQGLAGDVAYDARLFLRAAATGSAADVRALLALDGNDYITVRDSNGRTALILAAARGRMDTSAVLLAAGADVNAADDAGMAPLSWSIMLRHPGVAEMLLQRGADVNSRNDDGVSPLHFAVATQQTELIRLLALRGADLEAESTGARVTPMLLAIQSKFPAMVAILLDQGASIDGTNRDGYSPLMAAAESGDSELALLFLERGANRNARDVTGSTAVVLARKSGNNDVVHLLENFPAND